MPTIYDLHVVVFKVASSGVHVRVCVYVCVCVCVCVCMLTIYELHVVVFNVSSPGMHVRVCACVCVCGCFLCSELHMTGRLFASCLSKEGQTLDKVWIDNNGPCCCFTFHVVAIFTRNGSCNAA